MTFVDSSALVKLYADEEGHFAIRALSPVTISQVARVEVPAAIWRKCRMGELAPEEAQLLTAEFEADYFGSPNDPPRFSPVAISGELLDDAARLAASHGLRAYDAVQLSSALASQRADPECVGFAAFDNVLRIAAATEGFTLIPAQSPETARVR